MRRPVLRKLGASRRADKNRPLEVPCPYCALDRSGLHVEGAIVDLNAMRVYTDAQLTHDQGLNMIYICLNAKNNQGLKVGEGLHSEQCDAVHMYEGVFEFGFHAGCGGCGC